MKTLIFAMALIVGITTSAQKAPEIDKTFIRVFDPEGKRIARGKILSFSDTTMLLKGEQQIDLQNIGYIKTKRSKGNNVLIGTVVGGLGLGGFAAAITNPDDSYVEISKGGAFATGVFLGAPLGALVGWISSFFKKTRTFIIDGDAQKWREFQDGWGASRS